MTHRTALEAVAAALARRRPELERMAQEAVAEALAARGRDPGLARLIAGPAAAEDERTRPSAMPGRGITLADTSAPHARDRR